MQHTDAPGIDVWIRYGILAALAYWSFILLLPFIDLILWAIVLAVALYPLHVFLTRQLRGRVKTSALIITLTTVFIVVGAVGILANNMFASINHIIRMSHTNNLFPDLPTSIATLPYIGESIREMWTNVSTNASQLVRDYSETIFRTGGIAVGKAAYKGLQLLLFILSILFAGYLLVISDKVSPRFRAVAKRVSPERGVTFINIMKDTIQNVSRGVIGISILQAILFGLILLYADIPGAGLLSFITLILCIVQIGMTVVAVPVALWLFYSQSFVFALVITILMALVGVLEGILKPYLLSRGLPTPMLLILFGVLGGVATHGVIGIFIGPVVLSLFYDLVISWFKNH